MRLRSLHARSFLAFRGDVELDVEGLGPGLVAIVGPNGQGKTTLLELLYTALYRTSPSRRSALPDLVHGSRDALVEATFTNGTGEPYRARLLIDGTSRKQEAYLERSGEPVTSGRCPDFDVAVAERFGPPEVWLASVLACQKRTGDFLRAGKGDRKAIFAEMLGLQGLQAQHETAKEAARILEARVDVLRGTVRELDGRLAGRPELEAKRDQLAGDAAQAALQLEEAEAAVGAARDRMAELRAKVGRKREAQERLEELQLEDEDLQRQQRDVKRRLESAAVETTRKRREATARYEDQLGQEDRTLRVKLADLEGRQRQARAVLAEGEAIRRAVIAHEEGEVGIGEGEATIVLAREAVEKAETGLPELRAAAAPLQAHRDHLARIEQDVELLRSVPCGDAYLTSCQFLTRSAAAEGLVEGARTQLQAALEAAAKLTTAEGILAAARATLKAEETVLAALRSTQAKLAAQAKRLPELEAAETRLAELGADLERARQDADARGVAVREQRDRELAEIDAAEKAESETLAAEVERVTTALAAKFEQLEAAQAELDSHGRIDQDVADAERAGREGAARAATARTTRERLAGELGAAQERLAALDEDAERCAGLGVRIAALLTEAADWTQLAKACGKDGIQALEIDAAGPEVSGVANALLAGCYGPRFSISLQTTAEKQDGGKKEVFDVRILDEGQERVVEDLSGGQEVIIREALSLALAIFQARRSGQRFETLFRDETAGALDPDHAQRYVRMLRQALKVGGFHQLLFVSHAPEIWEQADARVYVEGGAVRVEGAPAGEAVAA